MISPTVLTIPHGTQDIPHGTHISHGTEHTLHSGWTEPSLTFDLLCRLRLMLGEAKY